MKLALRVFFLSLLFASTNVGADTLKFNKAWIPEAPPGASVMAGFMEIQNTDEQSIRIKQISSPNFERVQMHLSSETNGIASMQQQESLAIKAGSTLVLAPGSYHLMLIKPARRYLEGDSITLSLTLSNAKTLELSVPVKKTAVAKNTARSSANKCGDGKCGHGKCGGAK